MSGCVRLVILCCVPLNSEIWKSTDCLNSERSAFLFSFSSVRGPGRAGGEPHGGQTGPPCSIGLDPPCALLEGAFSVLTMALP